MRRAALLAITLAVSSLPTVLHAAADQPFKVGYVDMNAALNLIDEGKRKLAAGTTLLVCSDGVESLDHEKIAAAATRPVRHLLDTVLAVGKPHQDNVTIIKLDRQT